MCQKLNFHFKSNHFRLANNKSHQISVPALCQNIQAANFFQFPLSPAAIGGHKVKWRSLFKCSCFFIRLDGAL